MYKQARFEKQDPDYIFDFITRHPFATFVLNSEHLLATHIPVLPLGTPDKFRLFGHIAHNNEQFSHVQDGTEALLIFHGSQGYISSSWYREKDISTWNYSAVHVNVKIKVQDQEDLEWSLEQLVTRFEKDEEAPLFFKDLPKKMIAEHLPLIKGFWCEPFKVQGIAKLSQGKEQDVPSVIERLENSRQTSLASDIRKEHDNS